VDDPASAFVFQIIGGLAGTATVAAYVIRNERAMLAVLVVAMAAWTAHYGGIEAWTAAIGSGISGARFVCTLKWRGSVAITVGFSAAFALLAAFTWSWPSSPIAAAAMILATWCFNHRTDIALRRWLLAVSFLWGCHHLVVGSIGGLLTESILVLANLYAMKNPTAETKKNESERTAATVGDEGEADRTPKRTKSEQEKSTDATNERNVA
jgi:hypothetical protein